MINLHGLRALHVRAINIPPMFVHIAREEDTATTTGSEAVEGLPKIAFANKIPDAGDTIVWRSGEGTHDAFVSDL
jgi:hypothetical protein